MRGTERISQWTCAARAPNVRVVNGELARPDAVPSKAHLAIETCSTAVPWYVLHGGDPVSTGSSATSRRWNVGRKRTVFGDALSGGGASAWSACATIASKLRARYRMLAGGHGLHE
jgi:hypothetical protein